MKKQNKPKQKKQINKRKLVLTVAAVLLAVLTLSLVIVLPLVKINSDFDRIFDKIDRINDPELVITDMGAENVYGNTKGEVRVVSEDLANELCRIAEDFRYKGKDSDSLSAWDIRIRVKTDDGSVEVYLDKDNMYYVSGGNYYRFVPRTEETEKSYADLLSDINKLLEK